MAIADANLDAFDNPGLQRAVQGSIRSADTLRAVPRWIGLLTVMDGSSSSQLRRYATPPD
jgi:hypothetical protein